VNMLNMMISSSIHFPANDMIALLFLVEWYSTVHIYHIFFIHSSVDGHWSWLPMWIMITFSLHPPQNLLMLVS
jgi:hypothetical protein